MDSDNKEHMINDKEVELFERLKICLMLNELYDIYKEKYFVYKNNNVESYISSFQLKQISFAYIDIVLKTLKLFKDDDNYKEYISRIKKLLKIKIGKKNIAIILKDFRDKTFHPQNKSFSNTVELYEIYFNNIEKVCNDLINIFEEVFDYIISDKNKMVRATFGFYESKFYKELNKVGAKK